MKVAIIEEWLVYGGAARVLEQVLDCFPDATLFATLDCLRPDQRDHLKGRGVVESPLRFVPGARAKYRWLLPLMPAAVRCHNLAEFDVVLSLNHSVANGARVAPHQLHLSYTHTPMRYAWDMKDDYLEQAGIGSGGKGQLARLLLEKMRRWDLRSSASVQRYAVNSQYIAERVRRCYNRDATVIYPPVDVDKFTMGAGEGNYYLAISRFVAYKKLDTIAGAFAGMPDKTLVIVGDGPERERITAAAASPNVTVLPYQPEMEMQRLMRGARAFVYAADEDFGILPVEAQACGVPVIAYGKGGVLESVRGLETDRPTGVFFHAQTEEAIRAGVDMFEKVRDRIDRSYCRQNALRFAAPRFRSELRDFVAESWMDFRNFRGEAANKAPPAAAERKGLGQTGYAFVEGAVHKS